MLCWLTVEEKGEGGGGGEIYGGEGGGDGGNASSIPGRLILGTGADGSNGAEGSGKRCWINGSVATHEFVNVPTIRLHTKSNFSCICTP